MNLLFDGNYFGYRSLYIAKHIVNSEKFLDDEESQLVFLKKLSMDFLSEIRKFDDLKRVIFSLDSHSWRKDIYSTYKNSRKKDDKVDSMNWKIFFELLDQFSNWLETRAGVYKFRINNSETDDNIFLWKKYLLDNNESLIMIATDKDLYQCIDYNNDALSIIYNNHSQVQKFFLKNGTEEHFDNLEKNVKSVENFMDIMDSKNMFKEFYLSSYNKLKQISKTNKIKIEEIDYKKLIFEKIFIGDNSDDIHIPFKSVSGENLKITRRETNYLYSELMGSIYKNEEDITLEDLLKIVDSGTFKILKNKLKLLDNTSYDEILQLKKRLVILNEEYIPQEIQDDFNLQDKTSYTEVDKIRSLSADDIVIDILGKTTDLEIYSKVY